MAPGLSAADAQSHHIFLLLEVLLEDIKGFLVYIVIGMHLKVLDYVDTAFVFDHNCKSVLLPMRLEMLLTSLQDVIQAL